MMSDTKTTSKIDDAYVDSSNLVLDPSKLDKSLIERLPTPSGWRLLILPYRGKGQTEGGIQLVKETIDREGAATVTGYVLKVGPLAYKDDKFDGPWCKEGDWIIFGRYSGLRFRLEDDAECRIINDDDVIGTIGHPDDIKTL
jgi:co-chaperonin GroES (HSP10)